MPIDKLDLQSPDLVNENFDKLAALFPNCVTEGAEGKAIDFDLLKQELSHAVVEGNKERYRLEWPGKREAIVTANLPTTKTLRPVREDSVDFDNTENLYIEGDNLEVLKLLQESYLGKIKMIYIDPPYNTGKDFVYKDNFSKDVQEELIESGQKDEYNQRLVANPETAGRYHSDWLSMMYPRLKLARNLLSKDGVIFISIDDNELDNLKKVCDEIFGITNDMFTYTVKVRYEGKTLVEDMLFQKVVENVLVYAKSRPDLNLVRQKEDYSYDKFIYDIEELGSPEIVELGGKKVEIFKNDQYKVVKKEPHESLLKEIWASGSILDGNSSGRFFRDYLTGRYRNDGLGVLYKVHGIGDDARPYRYFTGPKREGATKGKYYQGVPNNISDDPANAQKEKPIVTFHDLAADFGNCRHEGSMDFRSGKKPLEIFKKLFEIIPWNKGDAVLDFFSGSASCAHAVLNHNVQDELARKFIMVQLPEATDEKTEAFKEGLHNICEIGKERIRRAAKKIKEDTNADIDYGFRVYRLDSSNMQDVYYKPQDYDQGQLDAFADNVKADRTADDLLAQVMLDWGLPLSLKIDQVDVLGKKVFKVADNSLYACFDTGIDDDFAKAIAEDKPLRVVFKDSGFKNDTAKTNVKQLLKQLSPETEMKVI